ncbi:hypothetical protein GJ496_005162 [Pomphorhynchus laevis]|nr:hypothetical protein GJ496_005162 [Pomphorhynchus laevis]
MVRERKDIASQLEWEQMLQESGVKVLEIYERWCGPCQSLPDYIQSNYTALIEQIIPRKTSITSIKERSSSSPSSSHHVVVDEDDSSQLTQYTTCSDSIDQFRKYVGHCRPILMIYNGRTLCHTIENGFDFVALEKSLRVAIQIRDKTAVYDSGKAGSKSPKEIQRKERFAGENASLPSSMMDTQRTVYDVPLEGSERSESLEKIILETGERIDERHWVVPEPIPVSLSAVIIKPNIASDPNICDKIVERLLSGHADQPIQQRTSFNVTIYQQERTVLRPDVIMSSDLSSGMTADQKDRLRKLMLGGESIVMLLIVGATGTCGFEYLRSICGPREPALARQQEPQSLRALYGGADLVDNAVHISENTESASQLISLLYPRLDTAYVAGGIPLNKFHQDQRTLCIIRPSAYMRFEKEIKEDIMNNGFEIAFEKSYNMRFDEAKHIYSMHRNKHYFDDLIAEMTCASALILCLSKVNAVEDFRKIIGPSTMDRILLAPDR